MGNRPTRVQPSTRASSLRDYRASMLPPVTHASHDEEFGGRTWGAARGRDRAGASPRGALTEGVCGMAAGYNPSRYELRPGMRTATIGMSLRRAARLKRIASPSVQIRGKEIPVGLLATVAILLVAGLSVALPQLTRVNAASTCQRHTVVPGDTLGNLGWAHHVSALSIARANHIEDADVIYVGQRLCIPTSPSAQAGSAPVATATSALPAPATSAAAPATGQAAVAASPTSSASGAGYAVVGSQILDPAGAPFTPEGVQLMGPSLAERTWSTNDSQRITQAMVQTAHSFWHANTTRLQISSANLLAQSPYAAAYLARIDQIVGWASALDMNIILSLQYEVTTKQTMPTQDSVAFWQVVAAHYQANPHVFFDVFNEPNPAQLLGQTTDQASVWAFWHDGGVGTDGTHYVGLQQLVDAVRGTGAHNLIFAEGPAWGHDLRLLPSHLLQGANLVYAIHPYLNSGFLLTPTQWDTWFGNFAAAGQAPVVADEWGEFEGQTKNACIATIATLVPQFLRYLAAHRIGLIAFTLAPGVLIRGWSLTTPTQYDVGVAPCGGTAGYPKLLDMNPAAQGAGQDIRQFLASQAHA
jgi:endoglucanase